MREKYTGEHRFDVIDKDTPGFLDKIGKRELGMLIHMLEDLNHSATPDSKKAYGYHENPAEWDEAKLEAYKAGALKGRMEKSNYTFFRLFNEQGELVGLASGNVGKSYEAKDAPELRLLNVTVAREHRQQGHATELMKRVSDYAEKKGLEKVVIPLSIHAQQHIELYQRIAVTGKIPFATELENTGGKRAHPKDPNSCEIVLKATRFRELQPEELRFNIAKQRISPQAEQQMIKSLPRDGGLLVAWQARAGEERNWGEAAVLFGKNYPNSSTREAQEVRKALLEGAGMDNAKSQVELALRDAQSHYQAASASVGRR